VIPDYSEHIFYKTTEEMWNMERVNSTPKVEFSFAIEFKIKRKNS